MTPPEAFDFAGLKASIAEMVDTDLTDRGITILETQPIGFQNCKTPTMFPSRNPTVTVQEIKRFSFGQANPPLGIKHKGTAKYTLDYVYLHIEYTQGLNQNEYEVPISRNLAAIARALTRNDRRLGAPQSLYVQFQSAEIDYNLQEPVSGKQYLGAHVVLAVTEIFEL